MNDCHGDHYWNGSGICHRCYERLRCYCGAFVREDNIEAHMESGKCRFMEAALDEERRQLESTMG